ncbi:MAG: RNA polymerase sigma factor [Clostridia bacterium]|nr:RNA polymerase sigma factor [Clostridia bacterium]
MAERDKKTTESLYHRFFRGDREAVAELVNEHRVGLILFINGYVRRTDVAEDLASDAFAALLVKRPKIKDAARFKTYLFSIAKNGALTWLRKNKRLTELDENAIAPAVDDPELELIREEEKRVVFRAIEKLTEEYRSVLILRYYEELSAEHIAKIMKKNKKQVYNLLQRAKSAMKNILEEEGLVYETD